MRSALPAARPGARIGLLGGSFDPAHRGHVHISRVALTRFALDEIWWLVTPGNPLKTQGPAPLEKRMVHARALVDHPRIRVSDLEARIGTRFTAATLQVVIRLYPQTQFTWLMGADNLAQFHRWDRWEWIMENIRVGVIARPGDRTRARMSKTARTYGAHRLPGRASRLLSTAQPPAWCFVNAPMINVSSTKIRARGAWLAHDEGPR